MEALSIWGWIVTIVVAGAWLVVAWSMRDVWTLITDVRSHLAKEQELKQYTTDHKAQLYK